MSNPKVLAGQLPLLALRASQAFLGVVPVIVLALVAAVADVLDVLDLARGKVPGFQLRIVDAPVAGAAMAVHFTPFTAVWSI